MFTRYTIHLKLTLRIDFIRNFDDRKKFNYM